MDFKTHITFRQNDDHNLVKYLEENKIEYYKGEIISTLDILESDPHWINISKIIKKHGIDYLTETVFSKNELCSADWLTVRSVWRYDYPQPENKYSEITYDGKMCDVCCGGLTQVDAFRFKKAPKWGKRFFLTTNWETDVLFLSENAKRIIESENIPGIAFKEVKNKSGTESLSDIYQLVINNILPKGLVFEQSPIREKLICGKCGTIRFHPHARGQFIYYKEAFDNAPDIVQTSEIFGWGGVNERKTIVSQKIYQLITDNKMDRSLEFQPIKLI